MNRRTLLMGAIAVLVFLFLPLFILGIVGILYGFMAPKKWKWALWLGGSAIVAMGLIVAGYLGLA
jgi:hypothetical protein